MSDFGSLGAFPTPARIDSGNDPRTRAEREHGHSSWTGQAQAVELLAGWRSHEVGRRQIPDGFPLTAGEGGAGLQHAGAGPVDGQLTHIITLKTERAEGRGGRVEQRVNQASGIRGRVHSLKACVLRVEDEPDLRSGEDGQTVAGVGGAARDAEFKVRSYAAGL